MVRLLKRRELYRGHVIRVVRDELRLGTARLVREIVEHPGSVVIVPLLSRERVILVRQYRHAVKRRLLELPAGTLQPPEGPLACARRELEEETGFRARRLRRLIRFYPAPGILSERMTVFLATGLTKTAPHPEPDEHIRVVIMPLSGAMRRVARGEILDAKTLLGLLMVSGRRDTVRRGRKSP